MKKLLIVSCSLFVSVGYVAAQNGSDLPGSNSSKTTVTQPREATINGIPYSQYKAQQDALKRENKQINIASTSNSPSSGTRPVSPAEVSKPASVSNGNSMSDDIPKTDKKVEPVSPKTDKVEPVQSPVVNPFLATGELKTPVQQEEKANEQNKLSAAHKTVPVVAPGKSAQVMSAEDAAKMNATNLIADKKVEAVKTDAQKTPTGVVLPAGLKLETAPATEKTAPAESKSPASTDSQTKAKTE